MASNAANRVAAAPRSLRPVDRNVPMTANTNAATIESGPSTNHATTKDVPTNQANSALAPNGNSPSTATRVPTNMKTGCCKKTSESTKDT